MSDLALSALSKSYGGVVAVERLDLNVAEGEFVSLLGPSGCGKTTTLQMIAGFVEPSGGDICLDGRSILKIPADKRRMGIVFQSYALFPHMTVWQNVAFGLEMRRVSAGEIKRRVEDVLAIVGLADKGARYPRQLSGGQQQRVALARAIVVQPTILLLDEPLSNLDAKLREDMQVELRQIQKRLNTTTVLVTHDQHEALALSDRIVVMDAGRVEQIGSPLEVYDHPSSAFVASFLGKTNRLAGYGDGSCIRVAGHCLLREPGCEGRVSLSIRPEKLQLAAQGSGGLPGLVVMRVFQGDHWLLQVGTDAGEVVVTRPNTRDHAPAEGEAVVLTVLPGDAHISRPLGHET